MDNIWAVEGKADHYVWQLMRKRGVPEKITGSVSDKENGWPWLKCFLILQAIPHMNGFTLI